MNIIADTHTHTLACDHAYSTLTENVTAAAERGLRFLAMTEHSPSMPGAPDLFHFVNTRTLPHEMLGVTILKGAEVNIMDDRGRLDLPDEVMEKLDWVIASLHITNYAPGTKAEHTQAWLAIAENPLVDVIGHSGDERYPFDEKTVIRAFARHGKLVEINSHSFLGRPGSAENCPRIARLCAEEGVRIVVSSDAHFHSRIGEFQAATDMLIDIGFPQELIVNGDFHRFLAVAKEKAGRPAMAEHLNSL